MWSPEADCSYGTLSSSQSRCSIIVTDVCTPSSTMGQVYRVVRVVTICTMVIVPPVTNPVTTSILLKDLRQLNIRASFFLAPAAAGRALDKQQCRLLQEMLRDGHAVHCRTTSPLRSSANLQLTRGVITDSFTHRSFLSMSPDAIKDEISQWESWYEQCGGLPFPGQWLFRPPFGELDRARTDFLNTLDYTVVTYASCADGSACTRLNA